MCPIAAGVREIDLPVDDAPVGRNPAPLTPTDVQHIS
jgi:hypothetical protein